MTGTIEQLRSSLITSGLPSTAFTLSEISRGDTEYVFLAPTFDTPGNEFITARWVWLISYDNRFLATTENETEGYALPKRDIEQFSGRLQTIDSAPTAAIHTYFTDHNLNPEHITVTASAEYITTPDADIDLTIAYVPNPNIPEEAQKLELEGWNEATDSTYFESVSTEDHTVTITVEDARTVLAEQFGDLKEKYWQSQSKNPRWALDKKHPNR